MRIAMIGARGVTVGARGGGIERHVAELSRRLAHEHEVTVYCRAVPGEERPLMWEGVQLRYVPTVFWKYFETLAYTKLALWHALRGNFDVIHLHGIGPGALAGKVRWFTKAAVVVTLHGQDQFHGKWGAGARWALQHAEAMAVRGAQYAIAVSHALQVLVREKYGVETVYIPNGVAAPVEAPAALLMQFGLQEREYFLAVARLVPQKGLHELVQAFRGVKTEKHLVIVGTSSYSEQYVKQLEALAKEDPRVRLLGYQEGDALAALYRHAYCFVHPSHAEGLSVAVLEAMSYGLAPLVADIPANVEAIAGNGFTFKVGDVVALQERLAALKDDEVRMVGAAAAAYVREHCTWDAAAEKTAAVYRTARH